MFSSSFKKKKCPLSFQNAVSTTVSQAVLAAIAYVCPVGGTYFRANEQVKNAVQPRTL